MYLEPLELATWCSGTGGRWAERRVQVTGGEGGHVEAATLWVHLDPQTMRPKALPESFHSLFGPSAQGRAVQARLLHADGPSSEAAVAARHPFPLRFTDFDVLDHVNNAVYWEAVEEELAPPRATGATAGRARAPGADRARSGRRGRDRAEAGSALWLREGGGGPVYASATIEPLRSAAG